SPDPAYLAERTALRERTRASLSGCAPAGAPPEEMEGYRTEAALRFWQTLEWIGEALAGCAADAAPSLLETGSNPYLLTVLLKERFPHLRHMGLNYFGPGPEVGGVATQGVVDPLGRLTSSSYLYADIERHGLEVLGSFDVCLFCEVLEHLPFD